MKLWPWVIACCLIFSHVALTDPLSRVEKVPEAVLLEGLTVVTVCIATESAGMTVLSKLAREEKIEPSQNSQAIVRDITTDAQLLFTGIQSYSTIGSAMVEALIKYHKHTAAELSNTIEQELKDTRKDIVAKLDDAADYKEFQEKFAPILENCNTATASYDKKVGELLEK